MDSSKSTEDDTIRDPMESGYVATRPRGTRARDTWKVNVRNLVAEDKRALDYFAKVTAARGGNAFLFPNLLPNWSFEFPPLNAADVALGWNAVSGTPQESFALSTVSVADGTQALSMATTAGQQLAIAGTILGEIDADASIPCSPGDVYQFNASLNVTQGTLPNGVLSAGAAFTFYDVNGAVLSTAEFVTITGPANTWQSFSQQFTAPANAVSFRVKLMAQLVNNTGAIINLDGSTAVLWDAVGAGLFAPAQMYGRTVGSDALPRPVRFTKLPEFSDIGWGGGVKRYGVNFEVTEV